LLNFSSRLLSCLGVELISKFHLYVYFNPLWGHSAFFNSRILNCLSDISANSLFWIQLLCCCGILEGRHCFGFSYLNFYAMTCTFVVLNFSFTSSHNGGSTAVWGSTFQHKLNIFISKKQFEPLTLSLLRLYENKTLVPRGWSGSLTLL
jgi:hypothetical protein